MQGFEFKRHAPEMVPGSRRALKPPFFRQAKWADCDSTSSEIVARDCRRASRHCGSVASPVLRRPQRGPDRPPRSPRRRRSSGDVRHRADARRALRTPADADSCPEEGVRSMSWSFRHAATPPFGLPAARNSGVGLPLAAAPVHAAALHLQHGDQTIRSQGNLVSGAQAGRIPDALAIAADVGTVATSPMPLLVCRVHAVVSSPPSKMEVDERCVGDAWNSGSLPDLPKGRSRSRN